MSGLEDLDISRKASILLALSDKNEEQRKSVVSEKGKEPKDSLYLVRILCFLMGFMNVMPLIFFSTAQTYWFYKFRDTSKDEETTQGNDRTVLQSYFQSVQMASSTLPNLLFTILCTFYGHKISALKRAIGALLLQLITFIILTIFTQISTDSWQTLFFIMTMGLLAVNSACTATFQMSSVVIMSKLPSSYMIIFLVGQNGTFITTSLQIIALSVTDRSLTTGTIYFTAGSIMIGVSLFLLLAARRTPIFKYYEVEKVTEEKTEEINWTESKMIIKDIWPCLTIAFCSIASLSCTSGIVPLIVSENDAEQTPWTAKYFTPVIAFLESEIFAIAGRLASKNFPITNSNKWWYLAAVVIRGVSAVLFYLFCRAEPRHLPAIFLDREFIFGHAMLSFALGFMMHVSFMSIKGLTNHSLQLAFKLMYLVFGITSAVTTLNSILIVKYIL